MVMEIRTMFDTLYQTCVKSKKLSKRLVVYKVNVKLKGRVIFRLERKCFGTKIYKLSNMQGILMTRGKTNIILISIPIVLMT